MVAAAGGRDLTCLIAVSKTQPVEKIAALIKEGQRIFGENRVQEGIKKKAELEAMGLHAEWHLIGPLQTNKIREAVCGFDAIHTVDSERLARLLYKEMEKQGKHLPCFIQVNTGREPQKAGVTPEEADALVQDCRQIGLNVVGLMCIPPADAPPAPHFDLLRAIAERNGLEHLSMGMSGDFEEAIRHGATYVRVGTALFGERY